MTDFGRNGQDLVLVLVNFSEISPLILNAINCVIFYLLNDSF